MPKRPPHTVERLLAIMKDTLAGGEDVLIIGWQHNLTPDRPWDLKLGGGLSYQYLKTALETEDSSVSAEVIENLFLPLVSAKVSYHFTPKFSASIQVEGMYLSFESSLEAGASLNYRLTEHWDITAGYTY